MLENIEQIILELNEKIRQLPEDRVEALVGYVDFLYRYDEILENAAKNPISIKPYYPPEDPEKIAELRKGLERITKSPFFF